MAESPPSADSPADSLSETVSMPTPDQDETPGENGMKSHFRQKKLLVVLGTTALAGMLLGVGGMTLIAYLQPTAKENQAPPSVRAPVPDAKQAALVEELKELKAKNEKLEEQMKLPAQPTPASAPDAVSLPAQDAVSAIAPVAAPMPAPTIIYRNRPTRAGRGKEKVTEDCTVPDKDEKLGDKLKSCIEGFNASTH